MKKIVLYFTAALVLIVVQSCNSNNSDNGLNNATAVDYHRLGDSLSNIAQQTLLSNVANAMQNGGPVHAIDFCNIHASGLMDSLSKVNDVQITRITDKARNSKNLAPANDMALLRK